MATAAGNAGDLNRALAETTRSSGLRPDWEMAALLRPVRLAPIGRSHAGAVRIPAGQSGCQDARRLLHPDRGKTLRRIAHPFDRLLRDFPDNPEIIYPWPCWRSRPNDPVTGKAQLENS